MKTNGNNLKEGQYTWIEGGNYNRFVEPDTEQAQKKAEELQQETDARIAGRMAIGMTLFVLGGGASLMPMTEALAVEATIGVTEIADKHRSHTSLGSTAINASNRV